MQKLPALERTFHIFFCILLIGLPFSKALVSIAFVGLTLISIISFFQNKIKLANNRLLIIPTFLFLALTISLFYSANLNKGLKLLTSQIDFLALPFIFLVHQSLIKERFFDYIKVFMTATSIAAFITFIFFLLPSEITQNIAATVPLLKEYIVHEKELAFGVYSPFTERLQFSYLLGVGIFFQLWLFFRDYKMEGALKILPLFKLLILLTTLLILGARGAQIGFLGASIIWIIGGYFYFIHPRIIQKFSSVLSYGMLIFGLFFFLIFTPFLAYKNIPAVKVRYEQMQWELGTFQDGTFTNYDYTHFTSIRRLLSWKNSWQLIQENPILGVGIGDYQAEMEKEYAKDKLGFPVNTQSQFLYFWTTSGILGLLSLLFLLGYSFIYFFKQKTFPLKLLSLSFFTFYTLIFLFDAPLNFQVGGMTFLIFYSLLVSHNATTTQRT